MTTIARIAGLGSALLVAGAGLASAGEYVGRNGVIRDYGSIKDGRDVVPVPAPNPANTPERDWYVRGDIGYGFVVDGVSRDHLFGGIGFGRYITPSVRSDITMDFKSSRYHDFVSTVNLYYDFNRHFGFKPYVGVGVGGAKFNAVNTTENSFGIAVAGMIGFTIDIAQSVKLDTGYRFTWSDSGATDGAEEHAFRTGIRIDLTP